MKTLVQHAVVSAAIPPFRGGMAHPELAEKVIERIMAFGSVEEFQADQVLYEPNQTAVDLYLLIHDQFEHFAPTLDGRDEVAFTFKAGEFPVRWILS